MAPRGMVGRAYRCGGAAAALAALAGCALAPWSDRETRAAHALLGTGVQATQGAALDDGAAPATDPDMTPDPQSFATEARVTWDGERTLQGIWIAHPDAETARRVRIVNLETGRAVDGALFRRDKGLPGPPVLVSSDAAVALGLAPDAPERLRITAIRYAPEAAEPEAGVTAAEDDGGGAARAAAGEAGRASSGPQARGVQRVTPEMELGGGIALAEPEPDQPGAQPAPGDAGGRAMTGAPAPTDPDEEATASDPAPPVAETAQADPSDPAGPSDQGAGPPAATERPDAAPAPGPAATGPASAGPPVARQGFDAPGGQSEVARAPVRQGDAAREDTPDGAAPGPDRPFVQAGIFTVEANARRLIERLRAAGLPAEGRAMRYRGGPATRVVAGPFPSAAALAAALETARRVGPDDALPVKE